MPRRGLAVLPIWPSLTDRVASVAACKRDSDPVADSEVSSTTVSVVACTQGPVPSQVVNSRWPAWLAGPLGPPVQTQHRRRCCSSWLVTRSLARPICGPRIR